MLYILMMSYPFTLPPLPYPYNALEPHIDEKTMTIHHTKHHQGYVDNLNAALKDHPQLQKKTLGELLTSLDTLPESVRTAVRNHGGGHFNHSFFWPLMKKSGGGKPTGALLKDIEETFGSFDAFKEQFNAAAKKVFGSGWAWLCLDEDDELIIVSTHNQDCPISDDLKPIMGLDVWEHAYYLKYQNRRPDYISAWWDVIAWDKVNEHYEKACENDSQD